MNLQFNWVVFFTDLFDLLYVHFAYIKVDDISQNKCKTRVKDNKNTERQDKKTS